MKLWDLFGSKFLRGQWRNFPHERVESEVTITETHRSLISSTTEIIPDGERILIVLSEEGRGEVFDALKATVQTFEGWPPRLEITLPVGGIDELLTQLELARDWG